MLRGKLPDRRVSCGIRRTGSRRRGHICESYQFVRKKNTVPRSSARDAPAPPEVNHELQHPGAVCVPAHRRGSRHRRHSFGEGIPRPAAGHQRQPQHLSHRWRPGLRHRTVTHPRRRAAQRHGRGHRSRLAARDWSGPARAIPAAIGRRGQSPSAGQQLRPSAAAAGRRSCHRRQAGPRHRRRPHRTAEVWPHRSVGVLRRAGTLGGLVPAFRQHEVADGTAQRAHAGNG